MVFGRGGECKVWSCGGSQSTASCSSSKSSPSDVRTAKINIHSTASTCPDRATTTHTTTTTPQTGSPVADHAAATQTHLLKAWAVGHQLLVAGKAIGGATASTAAAAPRCHRNGATKMSGGDVQGLSSVHSTTADSRATHPKGHIIESKGPGMQEIGGTHGPRGERIERSHSVEGIEIRDGRGPGCCSLPRRNIVGRGAGGRVGG